MHVCTTDENIPLFEFAFSKFKQGKRTDVEQNREGGRKGQREETGKGRYIQGSLQRGKKRDRKRTSLQLHTVPWICHQLLILLSSVNKVRLFSQVAG